MIQDQAFDAVVDKYLSNPKLPCDPLAAAFLKRCQSFSLKLGANVYKYYRLGNGPSVVLVHGVRSNLGSMILLASDLVQAGFRVVLFDLPAHGDAVGVHVDPIEVREMIAKLCRQLGDVHALVGHSLGGMWGLAAIRSGVRAQAMVTIGAPATSHFLVEKFVEMNEVDSSHEKRLVAELESRFGCDLWRDYSAREIVREIELPGLVIHGKCDDFVPPSHAEQISSNWSSSHLELVDGVGHFDSALSQRVRDLVTTYLLQRRSVN